MVPYLVYAILCLWGSRGTYIALPSDMAVVHGTIFLDSHLLPWICVLAEAIGESPPTVLLLLPDQNLKQPVCLLLPRFEQERAPGRPGERVLLLRGEPVFDPAGAELDGAVQQAGPGVVDGRGRGEAQALSDQLQILAGSTV